MNYPKQEFSMENENKKIESAEPICGVIMPISSIDGCSESHWIDVLSIITEAIKFAGFKAKMVNESGEVGIIQKTIIQSLYSNPIVVCDVSCKNSNVMFELGMRLAFDKPTIIIKDDCTSYSFDTNSIEHLEYPRDLRFNKIVEFKEKLAKKIKATYDKSQSDSGYTTFLKNFGDFQVAKIDTREVPGQEFIIEQLKTLTSNVARLNKHSMRARDRSGELVELDPSRMLDVCVGNASAEFIEMLINHALSQFGVTATQVVNFDNHQHLYVWFDRQKLELKDDLFLELHRMVNLSFTQICGN
jgi:hypothetical protein